MAVRVKDDKAQVHVGDIIAKLKDVLTEAVCDAVFAEHRTHERKRTWTLFPLMWFWVMVAGQGVETIREAVRKSREGWDELVVKVKASRQALCKRAQQLNWKFFMQVFHRVVDRLTQDPELKERPQFCQDLPEQTRKKWPRVLVLDASMLDPIARRLQILRKVKDQVLPGMVLAVYDLYWGIPRRMRFDPDAARSEHQMAIEWVNQSASESESELLHDALLVGDRLYGTLEFLAQTRRKGAWALVRRNRSVKIRGRRTLLSRKKVRGYGITLEDWQIQVGDRTGDTAKQQTLRQIKLMGGRRGTLEWFTNVLDPKRLTAWEAAEFYLRRWQVERMFATLKCVLNLKSFLMAHPNGVAHQVYAACLVYTVMRILQGEIAAEIKFPPEWLSTAKLFPRLRKAFHDYLVAALTVERLKAMNPGTKLKLPNPATMDFCWVDLDDLFVEQRDGRGHPRRGKPNWKSFRHVNGGSAWLN
jgi:hypothetical protein